MSSLKQLTAGAAANLGTIGSGMTLGFSAVALPAMQTSYHEPAVSDEEASWQFLVGAVANIATIAAGMTLGFSAVSLPAMQASHHHPRVSEEQASWIASLASISTPIGCLLTGVLLDRLGRKRTLMLINTPALLGWLIIATASHSENLFLYQLYAGRLLTGLATGMSSSPATVYVSEVADKALRGMLVTWASIGISLGILVVYVLGSIFQENWRLVAGISAGFPLTSIIAVWFLLPESPVWLMSRNLVQEAELSMRRIRSVPHHEDLPTPLEEELDAMISQQTGNTRGSLRDAVRLLRRPEVYKPLVIMNAFFFFQQFAGIFVVVFYAVSIVQETGVQFDGYLASVLIGLTRLCVTVLISFASRRYGRRILCNISGVGMTLSIGALTVFLCLMHDHTFSQEAAADHSWFPITALVLYILTSSLGFLTLPWAMIGEVFPLQIRGPACGATTCFGYLFSFIIVKLYPEMKHWWGNHGVFTFYTFMSLVGTVFMYVYLPETQGRTLVQIEEHFRSGGKARSEKKTTEELPEVSVPVNTKEKLLEVIVSRKNKQDKEEVMENALVVSVLEKTRENNEEATEKLLDRPISEKT
ncbi:facilitated trehalose transporter Tret1-2 homolog isoform X2 [Periplaneta americana]|uniref:facilitated trehalose transporter Tret1-2 homolog isoform X2 n=1 Tax=Periplaneta americana TaxID=6978 RepID=UPI0037E76CD3